MSDQPQGQGWWQASDGRWYPPADTGGPSEPPPTDGPASATIAGKAAGLQRELPNKVEKYMRKRGVLQPGESIDAVMCSGSQAIVLTDRRLIVVKVGFVAGSTGGGRVTSFDYGDVVALQVQLGLSMGSLSVQTSGYGATQTGDYWSTRNQQSPLKLPNVIIWAKVWDKKYAAELAYAQQRIATAHTSPSEPLHGHRAPPTLVAELQQLADLHAAGALSDAEFAAAKARSLEGRLAGSINADGHHSRAATVTSGATVRLLAVGRKKISVVQQIRGITDMKLKDAKAAVEGASDTQPYCIDFGGDVAKAQAFKAALDRCGATCDVV